MVNLYKRKLLLSSLTIPFCLYPNFIFSENVYNYILSGPLAGSIYYTKTKPGRWKNVVYSHIPLIKRKSNILEVITPQK